MLYKNSIKLLFSNFNIVWKIMLYFFSIFVLMAFLVYLLINPVIRIIDNAGFFGQIVDLYKTFLSTLNLTDAFANLSVIVENIFEFILSNISKVWFYFLGIAVIIFFVKTILFNLSNWASCVSLNFYMGSMTKQGFFASLSDNFGRNLKVQLLYYVVTLPINILYVTILIASLQLFRISWIVSVITIFALVVGFVLLMAFKSCLFSAWIPTIIVTNYGVFKSLKFGVRFVFKHFGRVFSNAIGIVITIAILNIVFGLFTFMVGLLISIPISYLLNNAFGMVVVYEGQGMKYYVDIYNVIAPKKKEISDKLKDMKYFV